MMNILLTTLCVCILFGLTSPYWWKKLTIHRWRQRLALDKAESMFEQLYANIDGFTLSRDARMGHDALDYVYGEINFVSFIALLSLAKPDKNTIFYDLGSGTGKAVLACAMVFKVKKSVGIELFKPLHGVACKQQQTLSCIPEYNSISQAIHFIHQDFLTVNLCQATLVFINATGFIGATWIAISQRLTDTKNCTTVISTSKALISTAFTTTHITTVQMSWGVVKAYIQQRKK